MKRTTLLGIAMLVVVLVTPASLLAGANTWTGGRPMGVPDPGADIFLAAHPDTPDTVFGAFGGSLFRSHDGGRTWHPLRSFLHILALLVHPASPSTVYVAGYDPSLAYNPYAVHKSTDGGQTWSRTLEHEFVSALAGSPTDASTVFAATGATIYKTTDAGATWSRSNTNSLSGAIASLVIDPREPTTGYAAAVGIDYWGITPGSVAKTTDGGVFWRNVTPPSLESVTAVAVDAVASSTVYVGTGPYLYGNSNTVTDVMRSEDGGATWASAGAGLRGKGIEILAADPVVSGTLYAGTSAGLYRSRDGGRGWASFGRQLAGTISSLSIADGGRRLYASTASGVYELEIARGPMDVAVGPSGESRVLVWEEDRLSLGALDAFGGWTSAPPGHVSETWTAVALAESGGGRTHVLWQNGDGRTALEILGPSGRQSVIVFASRLPWIASDVSVRADGQTQVLWTGVDGRMFIGKPNASGAVVEGPVYGPAPGWSAVAFADGPAADTWVLWRATDGRAALSVHRDGVMVASYKYAAEPGWSAEDVTVGADGRPRVLRTSPGGRAFVATVDAAGVLVAGERHDRSGFKPRRIAAGSDGRTRVLFSGEDGGGELLLLNADNTQNSKHVFHP